MFEPVKDDLGIRPDGTELISGRLGVPGRGARLYCRRWTRPGDRRGTIAIVPGFSDHGARYSKLTSAALDRGWDVSALDTRGHGRSEGRRGHVKRFADYYDDVNVWLGWLTGQGEGATHQATREPVVLWGHSMGGLIALGYLTAGFGPGVGVDACVVTSPSLTVVSPIPKWKDFIGRGLSRYAPWIHMASEIDTSHLTRDAEVCTAYERDPLVHGVCTPRLYTEMLGMGSSDRPGRAAGAGARRR
ncbi:MAG: alpha/beta fold hydrolase [Planctomycetota bacterium]|jgi:alpha-beta hydrolase superfamily lysophospholipase